MMPLKGKSDSRWARSLQGTNYSAPTPERAVHFDMSEAAPHVKLKKLPVDFAERVHEHKVLTTPGVAEGFEHANEIIEGWKNSL
jgi:hypothetical protein